MARGRFVLLVILLVVMLLELVLVIMLLPIFPCLGLIAMALRNMGSTSLPAGLAFGPGMALLFLTIIVLP